jgi:hypothetical protein
MSLLLATFGQSLSGWSVPGRPYRVVLIGCSCNQLDNGAQSNNGNLQLATTFFYFFESMIGRRYKSHPLRVCRRCTAPVARPDQYSLRARLC